MYIWFAYTSLRGKVRIEIPLTYKRSIVSWPKKTYEIRLFLLKHGQKQEETVLKNPNNKITEKGVYERQWQELTPHTKILSDIILL